MKDKFDNKFNFMFGTAMCIIILTFIAIISFGIMGFNWLVSGEVGTDIGDFLGQVEQGCKGEVSK